MSESRLYVGNLPFQSTEEDLQAAFGEFGTVRNVHLVTDRETGRSRGFAFVEMSTDEEARAAIEGMHGHDFAGRKLNVNVARPREERGGGGGGYGGGGGGYGGGGSPGGGGGLGDGGGRGAGRERRGRRDDDERW